MNELLSIITPVAPYHQSLIARVSAQVEAQTIPVKHIVVIDHDRHGAGWARNRGVEQAATPFVAFLDADDIIQPDFAAKMLASWKWGFYVYSDWLMGNEVQTMTDCGGLWDGLHHLVNCLLLREDFLNLGGFNETIEAEDTEFWLRAHSRGLCGRRCPYPLVEYTGDGQRSALAQSKPGFADMLRKYYRENPPMAEGCGGCGGIPAKPVPVGEKQPDDVLVVTLWGGNQTQVGRVTRRVYPRNGNGKTGWVDRRDAEAAPNLYKIIETITPADVPEETKANIDAVLAKAAPVIDEAAPVKPAGKKQQAKK